MHGTPDFEPAAEAATPLADARRRAGFSTQSYALVGDLLLLLDPLVLFATAWLATQLGSAWSLLPPPSAGFDRELATAAWAAALLSPFALFDRHFGRLAAHGPVRPLLRAHGQRLVVLGLVLGLVLAMAAWAGAPWQRLPLAWLALWATLGVGGTLLTRLMIARLAQHLVRQGRLAETIAVVGAGPLAQRLVAELRAAQPRTLDLLGVFDDAPLSALRGTLERDGSIEQLLALGTVRRIDWIVLALPPTDAPRVHAMVQRLKSLSVPIALCPPRFAGAAAAGSTGWLGHRVPVTLLGLPPDTPASAASSAPIVPRWLLTLAELAAAGVAALWRRRPGAVPRPPGLRVRFDAHGLESFTAVAAGFGTRRFGMVVTPNADHLIRLRDDPAFRAHYAAAEHVLLDSRFVAHLLRWTRGLQVPVCTGSDLTARLFERVIAPGDRIVLVGASAAQAQTLRTRHGLRGLVHFNPPMGFIHDPRAVEECLAFIEAHSPFRFCLLALGSPQQEQIATLLRARGRARGLALCIGASINFLTGGERRAPAWMQRGGLEWLYRLLQAPRRMGRRYLVRGPRVFGVLRTAVVELRAPGAASPLHLVPPGARRVPS